LDWVQVKNKNKKPHHYETDLVHAKSSLFLPKKSGHLLLFKKHPASLIKAIFFLEIGACERVISQVRSQVFKTKTKFRKKCPKLTTYKPDPCLQVSL